MATLSTTRMISSIFALIVVVTTLDSTRIITNAFSPNPTTAFTSKVSSQQLSMGLFDGIADAFKNEEYARPEDETKATARHILVPTAQEAQIVMKMIASGEQSFEACAQEFSTCPSASKGGSLGQFKPGTMVHEFDEVIFSKDTEVGKVVGPVLTDFGFHVIVVDGRTGKEFN